MPLCSCAFHLHTCVYSIKTLFAPCDPRFTFLPFGKGWRREGADNSLRAQKRLQFESWGPLSWDLTVVLQQWTGGVLRRSPCNPNTHEDLRSACRHMRQRCWSTHRVIAVIHCWVGTAIQSTTVITPGGKCWVHAVAPLSLSGSSYAVRDPAQEPVPVLRYNRSAHISHWPVCNTVSTKVNVGESSNPRTTGGVVCVLAPEFTGRVCRGGRTHSPQGAKPSVEVAWLGVKPGRPARGAAGSLSTAGSAFPSEQSLHTGWFSTEDLGPPQPSMQCLGTPPLLQPHSPQGKAQGA